MASAATANAHNWENGLTDNQSAAGEDAGQQSGVDSSQDQPSQDQQGAAGPTGEGDASSQGSSADAGQPADELAAARAEAKENWNRYLRSVAELDNLRKRNARDVENARNYGIESLVGAILPVRDSLEAGLKAADDADQASIEIGTVIDGDRATLRLLDQALDGAGIVEIDPEGEPFDPACHEAISMLPSDTAEPNSVIVVVQKGYSLNGRVVRPARVVVARAPVETDGS
jgi:molecular chaperone GrpE